MKGLRRSCAVIAGIVLLLAGILKLMDPVGAGLVVEEYFKFMHLPFMIPAAKVVGVAMAMLESLTGAAMIAGVWPLLTAIVSGVLLGGFTILTLILWILNPHMDCGCFGEAVHLTHFQSFIKNVVLLVLWAVAYLPKGTPQPRRLKTVAFWIAAVSLVLFALWSWHSIPAIDFTQFKPGVTLMQAENSPSPESPLLSVCDASGAYRDEILAEGPVMVFSAYDYDELPQSAREATDCLRASLDSLGVRSVLAVSASELPAGAYSADRRTLMTLNRSNGGATLISDGLIVAKWPARKLPDAHHAATLARESPTEAMMQENAPKRYKLQGMMLYIFAVLLLL